MKEKHSHKLFDDHGDKHFHINKKNKNTMIIIIILNFIFSLFEILVGVISGSLSLISDAFHNLEDSASLVVTFIAWKISFKRPDENKTYGYKRAEIIAAFVNSLFLFGICIFLVIEAVRRFYTPYEIKSNLMLIISFLAFLVNIISALILHSGSKENLNFKSSYLHLLGDALFSIVVFIGALFIKYYNIFLIDPVLSIIMSIYILIQTFPIFKKSFDILMQSSAKLNYKEIKREIELIDGVKSLHDIHTWMINENTIYFEGHIEIKECLISETALIRKKVEEILKERYKIYHTTIQFESDICEKKELFSK